MSRVSIIRTLGNKYFGWAGVSLVDVYFNRDDLSIRFELEKYFQPISGEVEYAVEEYIVRPRITTRVKQYAVGRDLELAKDLFFRKVIGYAKDIRDIQIGYKDVVIISYYKEFNDFAREIREELRKIITEIPVLLKTSDKPTPEIRLKTYAVKLVKRPLFTSIQI